MKELIDRLHEGDTTLVVANGEIRTFSRRGIADIYRLYCKEPVFLYGASVADKVVGKGAAALMALGGIKELYADIISIPALKLLEDAGVKVTHSMQVPQIWNRTHSGFCPIETLCMHADTPAQCLPLIEGFMNNNKITC